MRPLANWTGVYPSKWPVGVGMIIRGGDFLRGSFGNRSRLSPGKPRSIHNQALPELSTLAFVPPMCFDAKCKEDADRAFELAIGVPILAAILIGAYLARPPPSEPGIFEDKQTGVVFKSPEPGVIVPETDKNGELVYRAVSYTLYPLSEDAPGERIRIDVGPLTDTGPRTFVFERIFPYSQFVVCTLPRPLGIVFEEIKNLKRVTVGDFVPGSNAESLAKRGKLNPALAATTPRPGDVLRACSSVNIVYPTNSLFGAKAPQRHRVVYGCQNQSWPNVMNALTKGVTEDGPVTLVFERKLTKEEAQERGLLLSAETAAGSGSEENWDQAQLELGRGSSSA